MLNEDVLRSKQSSNSVIAKRVDLIGWGGGPGMTYGIIYSGRIRVEDLDKPIVKLTMIGQTCNRYCAKDEGVEKGTVVLVGQNTIREIQVIVED